MNTILFLIRFMVSALIVILFNCVSVVSYAYLYDWMIDFKEYKENMEKKYSDGQLDEKSWKRVSILCLLYTKFVFGYEFICRRLDPLNLFRYLDEDE